MTIMQMEFERQLVATLPRMRSYALGLTRNRADADDLLQDVTIKLLRSEMQFQMGTNFTGWAFSAVRNCYRDKLRSRKRHGVEVDYEDVALTSPASQEDALVLKELFGCINRLAPEHREVIVLVTQQGLSYEDTALLMKCPIGTVRSRLSRARAELKLMLLGAEEVEDSRPRALASPAMRHA